MTESQMHNDVPSPEQVTQLAKTTGIDLLRSFIQVGPHLNRLIHDPVQLSVSDRQKILYHVSAAQEDTQPAYGTPLAPDSTQYNAMLVGERSEATLSIKGTGIPLYSVALPVRDEHGEVVGSVMLSTDVTEAMRREEKARHAYRRIEALHAVSAAISQSLDLDKLFQIALDTTLDVMGLDMGVAFLLDRSRNELVFKCHRNMVNEFVQNVKNRNIALGEGAAGRVAQTGQPELIANVDSETSRAQRTGYQPQGNCSLAVIPLKLGDKVMGTMSVGGREQRTFTEQEFELLTAIGDQIGVAIENACLYQTAQEQLAELRHTQARLIQSAKLSAIGQLVAGIAHELNNPLTAVLGYTQLLQETVTSPEIRQDLDRIYEDAQRSARIVHNLLTFSRQQRAQHQYANINEAIERTLALRLYQFKVDGIEVELDMAENLPNTMFDVYQFQQVFLSILNNAHDAMLRTRNKGKLVIRTLVMEDKGIPYIQTEFIDNGTGLPPQVLEHMFEPFFTTKDVGEGMGLGLSIAYGIVQEHKGHIWIENRTDAQGARVVVQVPISVSRPQKLLTKPIQSIEQASKGRVLIVDDEEAIISLVTRLLSRKGYSVDAATSGEVALRRLQEHTYDLIISDIKMPGISGRVFYERVAEQDPALAGRIIFSTGDLGNPETRAFLSETHNYSLNKPFNLQQVEEIVEKAMQDLVR